MNIFQLSGQDQLEYHTDNLDKAREQAMVEAKPLCTIFYSSWDRESLLLEHMLDQDRQILEYLDSKYIIAGINVDQFDGYAWQMKNNIHIIPSILIHDVSGELVEHLAGIPNIDNFRNALSINTNFGKNPEKMHPPNISPNGQKKIQIKSQLFLNSDESSATIRTGKRRIKS